MDDVGQTLLNWASAFGTQEMVEYLCQKGADVNKGQRSSSLHYAACFGRPQIAKVLLRFGANPDLRDEDGMINQLIILNFTFIRTGKIPLNIKVNLTSLEQLSLAYFTP